MTYITNLETSPAANFVSMDDLVRYLETLGTPTPLMRKFKALARTGGINSKYSSIPDFSQGSNPVLHASGSVLGTKERNNLFKALGSSMLIPVCKSVLKGHDPSKITHVIAMTCTGLSAPGLEINLMQELGLSHTVQRHAINFMGCYAAIHAMRLAYLICSQSPDACVLLAGIELCTLHFRPPQSDSDLLSTYLFSDGVAAALISARPIGQNAFKVVDFASKCQPDSLEHMTWTIGDQGFEMYLSQEVPPLLNKNLRSAFDMLMRPYSEIRNGVLHYAIHPGGKAVLQAVSEALLLEPNQLEHSYSVLKDYGNMSSVTLLFVLKKMQESLVNRGSLAGLESVYAAAFGPGLSIEQMLLSWVQFKDN